MQTARPCLFAVLLFLTLGVSAVSANSTNLSFDFSWAAKPFYFSCTPYVHSFENGKHYLPGSTVKCIFSLPNAVPGSKAIAVYRGVPGNSTLMAVEALTGSPTLAQIDAVNFVAPSQDQDYFGAVYGASAAPEFATYFQTGSSTGATTTPGAYQTLRWKWGSKPASEFDPVIIIPGILGSWEKNGDWVVDPVLHVYDNLIDTFLANGYVEGKTLFRFGYDWEEPNEITAHILAGKIKSIKETCGCQYVDLIGHSMGGLVAMHYIENSEYANDVDQLFLVATPISGATKAYRTWEGGQVEFGNDLQNALMQTKFWLEARSQGFKDVFDYIRNKPIESIHELLPVRYDYLSTATTTLEYPNGYPVNGFLENLLANFGRVLNQTRLQVLTADNLLNNTVSTLLVEPSTELPKWEHGKIVEAYLDSGDGTVPAWSIGNSYGDPDKKFDGVNHLQIASTSAPYIFEKLNNKLADSIAGKNFNKFKSYLFFKLFSPIDMEIIAPNGKKLGKDFSNNSELNEIPDAFYSGFDTDNEYAIIPNPLPGNYVVKTIGTGTGGAYTIVADYFDGSTTTEVGITSTTSALQIINHSLMLSATTSAITIFRETLPAILRLTPDSCVTDMANAYKDKWMPKRTIYDGLVFDCKALKPLFKVRDGIEATPLTDRSKLQKALLAATYLGINALIDHMDLLAKDKTNTKEGVELIHRYTSWFRSHDLHQ